MSQGEAKVSLCRGCYPDLRREHQVSQIGQKIQDSRGVLSRQFKEEVLYMLEESSENRVEVLQVTSKSLVEEK